ncbi:MAG: right-handed parallel beta-helix repeat-containing protein, partial [Deltaproteobacteria bacterium]|nr:right-handed parallel beta-helix repeat-containing protein [Deltaproteobacteria bacterium]
MMKARLILICVIMLLGIADIFADECKISTSEELAQKLAEVKEKGACLTDNAKYRKAYEEFRGSSIEFHVLHFTKSMQIEMPLPCLEGYQKRPLIIVADSDLLVTIESLQSSCIDGKDGPVIIDNLHFKNGGVEIKSSGNAIINSEFKGGEIKIAGDSNHIVKSNISKSADDGIEVGGKDNKIIETAVHENSGSGIHIKGEGTKIYESRIYQNAKNGICLNRPAFISKTEFSKNEQEGIFYTENGYPSPLNLVSAGTPTEWKVTGDFLIPDDGIWEKINYKSVKIELFLHNGPFVAETGDFIASKNNPKLLSFVFTIPRPVSIDGEEHQTPTFVATAVDYENFAASPLSIPLNSTTQNDWDNDGIPNEQEDYNHNGLVDFGETDSRNSDTDGDGLGDGEERLHINRVSELIEKGVVFNDLAKLDPTNPDSDGDCILDGTELGLNETAAVSTMQSLLT